MTDDVAPDTPAIRAAHDLDIAFEIRVIPPAPSAEEAAERLGIAPERLLKTMVVRRAEDEHLFVLVPGPRTIDWPKLRHHLGVSRLSMPDADTARQVTGYARGTITPLGAHGQLPVLADVSIVGGGRVSIGGGAPGVAVLADADELIRALDADVADVT